MSDLTGLFGQLSTQLGVGIWLLVVIVIWSIVWKLLALWKSARKNSPVWFVLLAIINTVGILEILYIYVFSEIDYKKKAPEKKKRRK
jgi:hypothetical protein